MRNNADEESLAKIPTNKAEDDPQEFVSPEPEVGSSFWKKMKWLHDRGLHKGDYQEYEKPYYNLNKGAHYYVLDSASSYTIRCLSCPVKHGGILEAHLLTRYALKDGVLYFDGKPVNQVPPNFSPGA